MQVRCDLSVIYRCEQVNLYTIRTFAMNLVFTRDIAFTRNVAFAMNLAGTVNMAYTRNMVCTLESTKLDLELLVGAEH